ncbi:uncharacterized protein LOC107820424 isoform X1 [Nicotiana tabacum]|uniref:General transcription factor IIF subunit 1 isoform X1 n=1 Tax=Nicotiana tabacum TaxID=4097 RepID=A0A1S4CMC4_TOBAC|nr:PREDICTED: general transcription factor IIF subunit 1-like isoform X1 [Nicotiana tabacum]
MMGGNSNVFAALDSLRKKKKSSDKESKSSKGSSSKKEQEPEVLWAPAPLTVKSWADVDDEDDDDYYATTAPLQSFLGSNESEKKPEPVEVELQETESEEELLDDDEYEDVEEDHDHEPEVPERAEPVDQKIEAPSAPKEVERQLSKKERRKKELAELEALLADFGVAQNEKGPDELPDVANEKKESQQGEDAEKKNGVVTEPKNAKKKKKKDKASKEVKDSEDQPDSSDATIGPEETGGGAQQIEDASTVDVKEKLKRVASAKKKKSSKETDGAARAAAIEAAARSAKLAAAKKKEKNHYNQQPMR